MKFALVIHAAPYSSQGNLSALHFARALLRAGHDIYRLFFYADAVHTASGLNVAPQGELDLPQEWRALIDEHRLDAVVCIAAGLKRGIIDQAEAARYEKPAVTLGAGFDLSGLGQLLDAAVRADRVVTFGG